jgi:hypothetical protein
MLDDAAPRPAVHDDDRTGDGDGERHEQSQ